MSLENTSTYVIKVLSNHQEKTSLTYQKNGFAIQGQETENYLGKGTTTGFESWENSHWGSGNLSQKHLEHWKPRYAISNIWGHNRRILGEYYLV